MSDSSGAVAAADEGSGESQITMDRNRVVVHADGSDGSGNDDDDAVLGVENRQEFGRRIVMTTIGNSSNNVNKRIILGTQMVSTETQFSHLVPQIPSGKMIDIPTTSNTSSTSTGSSTTSSILRRENQQNQPPLHQNQETSRIEIENSSVVPPAEAPSGSGSQIVVLLPSNDESISSNISAQETINDTNNININNNTRSNSGSSNSSNNNNEIATIDTDTDDDVILVAPPMEVIEVDDVDDDEEDVQIVSHTRSQPIPKPLPVRTNRLMLNHAAATAAVASIVGPPVLPQSQFEVEEEIDTNLPVERLLDDLFNSHFGASMDFDLPILDAPSTSEAIKLPSMLTSNQSGLHSFHEKIRLLNSIEVQTDPPRSCEVATQTDKEVETQKRKW